MKRILQITSILGVINLVARLLGPVRSLLIANRLGISPGLDSYFIAQSILDLLVTSLTSTVLIVAIPAFIRRDENGESRPGEAKQALDSFLMQSLVAAMILTVLIGASAPFIARVLPNAAEGNAAHTFIVCMVILSLAIACTVPFAVLTGFFHSRLRIALPQSLTPLPILGGILALLLCARQLGILCLPLGILAGHAGAAFLLFGAYRHATGPLHPDFRNFSIVKEVRHLWLPSIVFASGGFGNLLVDRLVAAHLEPGAVSVLSYAHFLYLAPYSLIGLPLITALFPEMSRRDVIDGKRSVTDVLVRAGLLLGGLVLPVAILCALLSREAIEIFYHHGRFPDQAVAATSATFRAYTPAMLALAFNGLLQRLFFSRQDMKLLAWLTVGSISLNLILDLLLASRFGVVGLAWATSVGGTAYLITLLTLAKWRHHLEGSTQGWEFVRIALAGLVLFIVAEAIHCSGIFPADASRLVSVLRVLLVSTGGLTAYFLALKFVTRSLLVTREFWTHE